MIMWSSVQEGGRMSCAAVLMKLLFLLISVLVREVGIIIAESLFKIQGDWRKVGALEIGRGDRPSVSPAPPKQHPR
jgi:hypothetical protein